MSVNVVLSPFTSQNGCPSTSSRMQWHCLGCGAIESTKLGAIMCGRNAKGMIRGLMKLDAKDQRVCEVVRGAIRNSHDGLKLRALATSDTSVVQTAKAVSSYQFRTETGDQLKVLVGEKNDKYSMDIKVLSSSISDKESELIMSWGLFRSDSLCFMAMDFEASSSDGKCTTTETPFTQEPAGTLAVELDFESSLAPFYVSFVLKSKIDSDMKSLEIRSHRKTNFVVPVGFGSGNPFPLGLSFLADGSLNLALFSRSAERVVLCLYDGITTDKPALEIDLDSYINRTGDIWHASINSTLPFVSYGYRCKVGADAEQEHVLLDPYAKVIRDVPAGSLSSSLLTCLGQLSEEPPFDWGQEVRPCLQMEELFLYRLNVMLFTKDKSSKLPNNVGGTFSGITEKLHHFKDLGVNAILLEPIFPFDEQKGPYFPFHFFSPACRYGSPGDSISAIKSMKEMVKKLHTNGIEVFLEVVFTHTAEGAALRVIDNSYYHFKTGDDLGCENALNCNYPVVTQMILDSLRHWVIEFHIDGFCFINASSLLRGFHGELLSRPPLVEAIAFDPLLSKVKIIADSWDPRQMKSKEILFPHWKKWAEINNKFCCDVKHFLRGEGLLSNLATRLCGSGDVFSDGRGPAFSLNFISRNFGLSLVDLVSFSSSTKLATELSWNCGEEGPTNKKAVLERRLKQIRNFLFILFISLGVPILNMGDECGCSSGGSPAYDDRKYLDWNALRTQFGIQTVQFISFLSSLRIRRSDLLQKINFLREESIEWHGSNKAPPSWDDTSSKFLAMTLKANAEDNESISVPNVCGDLFAAFNGADNSESITLPPPPVDMVWFRLVDTALPFPGFFNADGAPVEDGLLTYEMQSHSCALFESRSPSG